MPVSSASDADPHPQLPVQRPVFIGGLHKSGGNLLRQLLQSYPQVQSIHIQKQKKSNIKIKETDTQRNDNHRPLVSEDLSCQGQMHQDVFPPDLFYGGAGAWAFDETARITEDSWLATDENRQKLVSQWGWAELESVYTADTDLTKPPLEGGIPPKFFLEYSVPNMLKMRFLRKLFPSSQHVLVVRHPLAYAFAMEKEIGLDQISLPDLVRHWLRAHLLWKADREKIIQDGGLASNFQIVYYEELITDPKRVLSSVLHGLGLNLTHQQVASPFHNKLISSEYPSRLEFDEMISLLSSLTLNHLSHSEFDVPIQLFGYNLKGWDIHSTQLDSSTNFIDLSCLIPEAFRNIPAVVPKAFPLPVRAYPRNILFVNIGSRGDIQPYCVIASSLAKSSKFDKLIVASPVENKALVESFGVTFASLGLNQSDIAFMTMKKPYSSGQIPHLDVFRAGRRGIDMIYKRLIEICKSYQIDFIVKSSFMYFITDFIANHLGVPYLHIDNDASKIFNDGSSRLVRQMTLLRYSYIKSGISQDVDMIYKEMGIKLKAIDNILLSHFKRSRFINCYSSLISDKYDLHRYYGKDVGFVLANPSLIELPSAIEEFLSNGPAPICVNFGSMRVFEVAEWAPVLLEELQACDHRCIFVGKFIPPVIQEWAFVWTESVNHTALFPKCATVIQHGGCGTTASIIMAHKSSIIVPVMEWTGHITFGQWLEREGAGVMVNFFDPKQHMDKDNIRLLFQDAIKNALKSSCSENAARLQSIMAKEDAVTFFLETLNEYVNHPSSYQEVAACALDRIDKLPFSPYRILELNAFASLHDPTIAPERLDEHYQFFVDQCMIASGEAYYGEDWPCHQKASSFDLGCQDLPHHSSNTEKWCFEAMLNGEKSEQFSFSVTFNRMKVSEVDYVHRALILLTDHQTGKFVYNSIGECGGPSKLAELRSLQPRTTHEFWRRALQEVLSTDAYPAPDSKSSSPAECKQESMYLSLDESLVIWKDGSGSYRIMCDDRVSGITCNLAFCPSSSLPVVPLGSKDGVSPKILMYTYCLTGMKVSGFISISDNTTQKKSYQVGGHGVYTHQFGGTRLSETLEKLSTISPQSVGWLYLDDGRAVILNPDNVETDFVSDVCTVIQVCIQISSGVCQNYKGTLTCTGSWASMQTYIEYGTMWTLQVSDIDMDISIKATTADQEVISLFEFPASWLGSVSVSGEVNGVVTKGHGFLNQYGSGLKMYSEYQYLLQSVSSYTLAAIDRIYPMDPTEQEAAFDQLFSNCGVNDKSSRESISKHVFAPLRMLTDRGGKAWRSMGALLCIAAVGRSPHAFRDFLALPEFLHAGSLLVDDVQDNSTSRRGGPCGHLVYGKSIAINAGTAAYFAPQVLLEDESIPVDTKLRIYQGYFRALRAGHAGQALDIHGLRDKVPDCLTSNNFHGLWEAMLNIHRLKSGIPAGFAAELGALLGGGSESEIKVLSSFFCDIGVAFQIIDDVINLHGFQNSLKQRGEDLQERKITAPVIQAFMLLAKDERNKLWAFFRSDGMVMAKDLEETIKILEKSGAIDKCIDLARELLEASWLTLDALLPNSFAKSMLRVFSWFVVEIRDY